MKTQSLWYVRHGGRESGPFPAKLVSQDFMLGRYHATDEASIDRVQWAQIQDIPALQPHVTQIKNRIVGSADSPLDWERERREAALRWIDERDQRDRRDHEGPQTIERNRRSQNRRLQPESPEWIALRERHADSLKALKQRRERFVGIGIVLLVLLALVLYAVFQFSPINPVKVSFHGPSAACSDPAASRINWVGCDKNGAWLKGADLSKALLSQARFNAANLSHANLYYANLTGADLSFAKLQQTKLIGANLTSANLTFAELRYADLRGAKLEGATLLGARLDHAKWMDGRVCAAISMGDCK